ncbi:MAG: FkbM family methyltransferase [Bryobacteraceae bacterium]
MPEQILDTAPAWVPPAASIIKRLPAGRYRAIEAICKNAPAPFWRKMPASRGAFEFVCDLRDSISREACFTGRYEPQETAILEAILAPGMTFVDIGANWGYFTLLACQLTGPEGRVISFEPDPRLFARLAANLARNGLRQATALPVAAAAEEGTLTLSGFEEQGDNYGLSRIVEGAAAGANSFRVRARPVDSALDDAGVGSVDLVKMDIEGAEDMALEGMAGGLERQRYRRILLELHPALLAERGRTAREVLDRLQRSGYYAYRIDHSPEAARQSAYARAIRAKEFLRPLGAQESLDSWPHVLLVGGGVIRPEAW